MLTLPDAWTWDLWFADDGERFHAFYLRASRALLDPERRHRHASVGHAVSADLRSWTVRPDALVPSDGPGFDDLAVWTGSVVPDPAGGWRMFHTGIARPDGEAVQRIGSAVSADLTAWRPADRVPDADPRWYQTHDARAGTGETWRDPWVFADPDGEGWHMLVTARAVDGPPGERGVVGHLRSADLRRWHVQPPLTKPGTGFDHLEVAQVELVEGRPVLIFSCLGAELGAAHRAAGRRGGVWAVAADSLTGPYDPTLARPLSGPELYSGRLVRDRVGRWMLLGFVNADPAGRFAGGICDPVPVGWSGDRLVVTSG